MGFVDSWAAVASGGLSLSENHLYTVEALQAYYDHLTPEGNIAILRWNVDIPRLVANAVEMLGPEEAGRRVAVLLERREGNREDPPQMIFMVKKTLSVDETERLLSFPGVRPVIVPAAPSKSPTHRSSREHELCRLHRTGPLAGRSRPRRPALLLRATEALGLPESMQRGFLQILLRSSPCASSCSPRKAEG